MRKRRNGSGERDWVSASKTSSYILKSSAMRRSQSLIRPSSWPMAVPAKRALSGSKRWVSRPAIERCVALTSGHKRRLRQR